MKIIHPLYDILIELQKYLLYLYVVYINQIAANRLLIGLIC